MKTLSIRLPAVAGMFYPASPEELREEVTSYLAHGRMPADPPDPKAMIAPHAGYVYSGPIAGSAYACLRAAGKKNARVLLLGPSHRVAFRGLALSSAPAFRTPLGDVPVDLEGSEALAGLPAVSVNDHAHRDEHSLEVHLPFLQMTLDSFSIVPVVVGDATPEEIAAVMNALWDGPSTIVVVSSDLSHYLPYDQARRVDRQTTEAIEALEPRKIGSDQACGRLPIQGLLILAKKHKLHAVTLDVRNSGDTAGDRRQVVGYGAYLFTN